MQHKTGASLTIPIHPELQAVLDKHASDHLTLLTTARGEPFTAAGFGNWFRKACDAAGQGCKGGWVQAQASKPAGTSGGQTPEQPTKP